MSYCLDMKIRNFVNFTSSHFVNEDQEIIDAGIFGGKTLCEYLVGQLNSRGFPAQPPELDDFAWTFDCRVNDKNFWIHVNESGDVENQNQWLLIVNSTVGLLRRLAGKTDEEEMKRLCNEFHNILSADERISDISWYCEEEWNNSTQGGAPTPS
jgi:hypothetical protein